MKWIVGAMTAVAIGGVMSGCAMLALAPGAEQIKETQLATDVAGCPWPQYWPRRGRRPEVELR
jgi:hypothetical protein